MRVASGSRAGVLALACVVLAVPSGAAAAKTAVKRHSHGAALPARRAAGEYEGGIGTRSINPEPNGRWNGQPVYLGGYGIGGPNILGEGRPATGILPPYGQSVRAIAVGDGDHALVIADIEAQGWFAQTKSGRGLMT